MSVTTNVITEELKNEAIAQNKWDYPVQTKILKLKYLINKQT